MGVPGRIYHRKWNYKDFEDAEEKPCPNWNGSQLKLSMNSYQQDKVMKMYVMVPFPVLNPDGPHADHYLEVD